MPKDSLEGRDQKRNTIRSTMDIKRGMLRRAFDGESKYTPAEVISMISDATRRSRTLSDEHRATLNEIDPAQPRSVLMLNAIARHEGKPERFIDATVHQFIMPDSLTLQ